MNKPLFVIENLSCSYKKGPVVLKIPQLEIPRNKIIVLLGKSGFGKSTLLETLGLMNNTISEGDIKFFPGEDDRIISYKDLWFSSKLSEIARIRREHFSFIFQNTNLMPNFTAYENACLTQMISGVSFQKAKEKVREVMVEMGLGKVRESQRAVELSGGQKQRLAFVRAITADFLVLFGDEPTGNLDNYNSEELMWKLDRNIRANNGSAIIVSHNVELSMKFADVLMVLSREKRDDSFCLINNEQTFYKDHQHGTWNDYKNRPVDDIRNTIDELFKLQLC